MDKEPPGDTVKKCWSCHKTGDEVKLREVELSTDGLNSPLARHICQNCFKRLEIIRWAVVICVFTVTIIIVLRYIVH